VRDTFFEVRIAFEAQIAVEFGGRPVPDDYAVMLQVLVDEQWQTVFLVDNAHESHHCHRYTGAEKGPAEPFYEGPASHAIKNAVDYIDKHTEELIDDWRDRTEHG
jgi:hypothetical protein